MNAKQKRALPPPEKKPEMKPNVGLTLQQVIALLDTRLIKLEKAETPSHSAQFVDEMDTRFQLLATELNELKDIVLKLQSYTMEVNKTLLEERIQFLSEEPVSLNDLQVPETELIFSKPFP